MVWPNKEWWRWRLHHVDLHDEQEEQDEREESRTAPEQLAGHGLAKVSRMSAALAMSRVTIAPSA